MSTQVASATVAVFPTFKGFRAATDAETRGAGQSGGKAFDSAFKAATANTAANVTKGLEAQVRAASQALSKARLSEADAIGKVRTAQASYNEALSKGGADSARTVAAEERLAAALRRSGEATAKVTTESDRLKRAQTELAAAADKAGSAGAQGASKFAQGWASLRGKLTGSAKSAVDEAARSATSSASAGGRQAGGAFSSGFKGAIAGIGAGLAAVGLGSFVSEAAAASDATDKFKATLNFAGVDGAQIDSLTAAARRYADQTVYDLADIQNVTAQLAANSVPNYDKLAQAAGNLNAVAGGNKETFKSVGMVLTQTAGAGKLTTQNWNQLANAIPGASGRLQEAMLKNGAYTGNFRDAMEKGQITADEFNTAIMQLGMEDVAKKAATSTKTFEGAWGNLKATMVGGLSDVLGKVKPAVTGAMSAAAAGIAAAMPAILSGIDGVGAAIIGVAGVVGPIVADLMAGFSMDAGVRAEFDGQLSGLVSFGAQVRTVFDGVGQAVSGFVAGFGGIDSVVSTFSGLLPLISGPIGLVRAALLSVFSGGGGDIDFAAVGQAAGAALKPVAEAAAQLAVLLTSSLATAMSQLLPVVMGLVSSLAPLAATLVGQLIPVVMQLVQAILPPIMALVSALVPAVAAIAAALIPVVTTLVGQLIPVVMQLVQAILPPLIGIFTAVAALLTTVVIPIVVGLVQVLAAVLVPAINVLGTVFGAVFGVIGTIIGGLLTVVQVVVSAVVGVFGGLVAFVAGIPGRIMSGLSGLSQLGAKAAEWVGAFVAAAKAKFDGLVAFVAGIPERIKSELGRLADIGKEAGLALMNSLGKGISDAAKGVYDSAQSALQSVANLFPHSPAKSGPFSGSGYTDRSGEALIGDFAKAIMAGAPRAVSATSSVLTQVQNQFAGVTVGGSGAVGAGTSSAGTSSGASPSAADFAAAVRAALSGAELRLTGAVDTIGDAVAGRIILAYDGAVAY